MSSLPFGIILGNILGTVIGGFVYASGRKFCLSLCAETGFTIFGLVEQDYKLPDYILTNMGLDLCQLDTTTPDISRIDTCKLNTVHPDTTKPDVTMQYVLRRGVIGINKIGYI